MGLRYVSHKDTSSNTPSTSLTRQRSRSSPTSGMFYASGRELNLSGKRRIEKSANQTRFVFKLCYLDVTFHRCFTDGTRLLESLQSTTRRSLEQARIQQYASSIETSWREATIRDDAIKIVSRTFQLSLPCNRARLRHAKARHVSPDTAERHGSRDFQRARVSPEDFRQLAAADNIRNDWKVSTPGGTPCSTPTANHAPVNQPVVCIDPSADVLRFPPEQLATSDSGEHVWQARGL
ncbi:hypothetical protein K0M31_015563 [Melipona bicolor]|uniref:Uncharacterized protein n=1 Tax=Melipona bicolor TaxID=60889 RepID=A0AA40FF94_9HYME|nr:hypothetical protein K0M31_015563 [Melipona bicolor]